MVPILAVLALLQANVATEPAPPPPVVTKPIWIRRPDGTDIAAAYPAAAQSTGKSGRATLVCTVSDQGKLTDCDVTNETPTGWGFGTAALSLAPKFQMKPLAWDGSSVAGGRISIPIILNISGF